MAGFMGPRDIFRNPESIFRIFEGPGQMFEAVGTDQANTKDADASPFELTLAQGGDDFAVMGMHFKLGLYEHQSAGALQAMLDLLEKAPHVLDDETGSKIKSIKITAYEPAFGIIGDPAKRNPSTRQSADHSMVYIVGTLLRKALTLQKAGWIELMLEPYDYAVDAINNERTHSLMEKIEFFHGGKEYDDRYPDGIPTSVIIEDTDGTEFESGMVMYPGGHARNTEADLAGILAHKFNLLGKLAFEDPSAVVSKFENLGEKSSEDIASMNCFEIQTRDGFE
jgi:2-methylcitrate dehydratase